MSSNNYNSHIKLEPIASIITKLPPKQIYKPDPLIYDKNEKAIINDAIKIGYLIYPSKEVICQIFQNQPNFNEFTEYVEKNLSKFNPKGNNEHEIDLNAIKHLNLSYLHVLEIGDVCFCERLQILNLSNNYIIRIDPLIQCTSLIRLDLNNNQVEKS
jgi:hypothetical protein